MKTIMEVISVMIVYTTLFTLGCWEANLARIHEPDGESSPGYIQGYVFAILSSILNIMIAVIMMCLYMMKDRNSEKNESHGVSLACVIAIWSIVLFAGMIDNNIRTGPFQPVVIAQFCVTMVSASLCCCSCGLLACMASREDPPTTSPMAPVEVVTVQV
jgi:hypothetical protein